MPLFDWGAALDVGVTNMNDEHKIILQFMNQLYDQSAAGADKSTLSETINKLEKATIAHFSDEENYMKSIAFPKFCMHKITHQDLLQKFAYHKANFENGNGEIPKAFFDFLLLWLSTHIQGIDRKYGEHSTFKKEE